MNFGQPSQTPEFLILSTEVDGQNGRPFRGGLLDTVLI